MHWLSWKRLTKPKAIGGMGFKDLRIFNLALLAKQGWKLISQPNSLVSRVLKSKYFKSCNFMDAKLGHNPSLTWRNILAGRQVLSLGVKQRVGNGRNIKISSTNWLLGHYGIDPNAELGMF